MIQKLEQNVIGTNYGCGGASFSEVINKVNEVIDYINSRPEKEPLEDLNKLIQKWDRIDINTVLKVKVKATGKVIDGFYDGRGHFDHFIDHDVFDRYSIDEVELMPEEKPSEDLNDEIKKFIEEYGYERGEDKLLIAIVARHFAEWQKEQMMKDWLKDRDGCFWDGVEEGKKAMKELMMKDAVEGEVIYDLGGFFRIKSEAIDGAKYKVGSWVKLIIVKNEE